METSNILIIYGKNMELSVLEDRLEMLKTKSMKKWVAPYGIINKILFRKTSYQDTGFIKVRANGVMFDFVTHKFSKKDSPEYIQSVLGTMAQAVIEINNRVAAARGLADGSNIVTDF